MKPTRYARILLPLAWLGWLTAVGYGLSLVSSYENSAGLSGTAPAAWPVNSTISRNTTRPTLVLFIHPHCPCSRATIGELAVLMAHSQGLVEANVVFVKPVGFPDGWELTDLWTSAGTIPSVRVTVDENGVEARRFGSETSGQVALYDASGQLVFSGGIAGGRGHAGDNDGRTAIQSILVSGKASRTETPVFGCPLVRDSESRQSEEFCNDVHRK